jgi:hypothetical protein
MSREIRGAAGSGNTLYARVINRSGLWWNGAAFEAYAAGHYANYAIQMTEQGASGVYVADMPAGILTAGTYEYYVHLQGAGAPAEGDQVINTGRIDWTGTAVVTASAAAMSGSDFRDYIVDSKGFKRTDKDDELYDAITDAIQFMRRRFEFDEAETEVTSTDSITVLGDFKLDIESDLGLLLGVVLEDGSIATPLDRIPKKRFDELYPDANVTSSRGYPRHYCVYAGQIRVGPIPDKTSYAYRLSYSKRAGAITSSTAGVPFTDLYRDVLAEKVLELLYEMMEEYDRADRKAQRFEALWADAVRRERRNSGTGTFAMRAADC